MLLVDSHCHLDRLDLKPFGGRLEQALDAARAVGVQRFLSAAVDLESWPALRRRVENYPDVALSVGVHPSAARRRAPTVAELTELARHPKVVAIGETGLDYFHGQDKERQQHWLRIQIAAALTVGKPLIIHTRQALEDTLRLLTEEGAAAVGGVIHCFSEDWAAAARALTLNFYISFSGIVTFPNAPAIQEAARRVPADRLLVETDSPYLAPTPHRGKSNQPAWVRYVAASLAQLRGETLEQVAAATTANYFRLFQCR